MKTRQKTAIYEKMIQNVLLKEAILSVGSGEKRVRYYIPDDATPDLLKNAVNLNTFKVTQKDANYDTDTQTQDHVLKIIDSFDTNPNVVDSAKAIYMEYKDQIDSYVKERGPNKAVGADSTPLPFDETWMRLMFDAADNSRTGAVGRGEVTLAIMYNGTATDQSEGSVDMSFGTGKYSVKSADHLGGPFALNGKIDEFRAGIDDWLKKGGMQKWKLEKGLEPEREIIGSNLLNLLAKDTITFEKIKSAIENDFADSVDRKFSLEAFIEATNSAVRNLLKDDEKYIFCTKSAYMFVDRKETCFDCVSQSKVKIKHINSSQNTELQNFLRGKVWGAPEGAMKDSARASAISDLSAYYQNKTLNNLLTDLGQPSTSQGYEEKGRKTEKIPVEELTKVLSKIFAGHSNMKLPDVVSEIEIVAREKGKAANDYKVEDFITDVKGRPFFERKKSKNLSDGRMNLVLNLVQEILRSR